MTPPKQMKTLALAYIGDAVIELYVRQHLLAIGIIQPHELHQAATRYVSAHAQEKILLYMLAHDILNDDELAVIRRGKNAKSISVPKHTSVKTYRYSTALEALIGYLHLCDQESRVDKLMTIAMQVIEDERGGEQHGT